MWQTFASLDDVLIERLFQPVADLVSHRIGLSRTASACFCLDGAALAWILARGPGLSDAVNGREAGTAALGLSLLLLGLVALTSLRTLFRRAGGKQANPLRQAMRRHRGVVLLMLLARLAQLRSPGLADAADVAMLLCAAAALYLGACAEPPPVRRRSEAFLPAPREA
jgi:hypothetical protein